MVKPKTLYNWFFFGLNNRNMVKGATDRDWPSYSTSSTASLKVKDKIEATLRVSWITRQVIGIFFVSSQFRALSSPHSSLLLIIDCCSSCEQSSQIRLIIIKRKKRINGTLGFLQWQLEGHLDFHPDTWRSMSTHWQLYRGPQRWHRWCCRQFGRRWGLLCHP